MNRLRQLLTRSESKRLSVLVSLLMLKALMQVIGIASILPFMSLVAKPELVHTNEWLNKVYVMGGFENERSMLIGVGIAILVYMAVANAFVAGLVWLQARLTLDIGHRIGVRMVRSYITEPYEFFLTRQSIDFLKRVVQEVSMLVRQVLVPVLDLVSQTLVSLVIFLMLVLVDAVLATTVFFVLAGAYVLVFISKRRMVVSIGEERVKYNQIRFRSLADLMGGIKEIQLYDARPYFFERFKDASEYLAEIVPRVRLVLHAPRYLVETLAYGGILLVTLYLLEYGESFEDVIPVLSLYALSGYKLIPALQNAFQSYTTIKHAWPVVDEIMVDYNRPTGPVTLDRRKVDRLPFDRTLAFKDVAFTYEGEESPALKSIDFEIRRGSKVAFVGRTGSGKTTLIDVLTGLLSPTKGEVLVDGVRLHESNASQWQRQIGYVTQELFLFDDTVTRNIAFGVPDDEIDFDRVLEAAKVAQAHGFVTELLPKGYDTMVGERGIRLSGGQRARLGLARALYRKPAILILDEATSTLDGITERAIIEKLVDGMDDLTLILIAHRMSSVKSCEEIFLLEDGMITGAGSFDELLKTSDVFFEMRELTS